MTATSTYLPTVESETMNYAMDIAGGLSQVLSDGTNTYMNGYNRISQTNAEITGYFLDDAIGSVRQVASYASTGNDDSSTTNTEAAIILARSYSPRDLCAHKLFVREG